ncbi:MAG: hypothetical protein H8D80_01680 [Proteobacteria bacterium]|nr:hypothetical protein [Pseudomonadota bacterium]
MLYDNGYTFQISKFTQLGNSLVQLCNAINVGIQKKSKILMPKIGTCNDAFDLLKDIPNLDFRKGIDCGKTLESKFFFSSECFDYLMTNRERREILQNYIFPHLKLVDSDSVSDDTLVIHIRSGDIFGGWTHKNYAQPPLSYYKKIIEEEKPSDVLIITQPDKRNPCIKKLLSWDSNIKVQCGTLREDVSAILKARKLVIGFGTFGWMLSMLSGRIHNLYCPTVCTDLFDSFYHVSPFHIKRYDFENYIKMGNWENTECQREMMISHPIEKIGEHYVNEYQ